MLLSIIFSLIGCILTGVQVFLIMSRGDGICFNEGCEIVDNLTLIPPLYFNLAGFLFFLIVALSLNQARKDLQIWQRFSSIILLAGLAAEGVLFSFQFFITEVFCSYCLLIFGLVALANIFMGLKQVFKGMFIFTAMIIAFASLDFKSGAQPSGQSLDDGSIAKLEVEGSERQLYLFFSETCPHCEDVIEEMRKDITCNVNFNPIGVIDSFSFPGAKNTRSYLPETNINFLKLLKINGVPTLVDMHQGTTTTWVGSRTIMTFLELNCSSKPVTTTEEPKQIGQTASTSFSLSEEDENCTVSENCDDETTGEGDYNQQSPAQ